MDVPTFVVAAGVVIDVVVVGVILLPLTVVLVPIVQALFEQT